MERQADHQKGEEKRSLIRKAAYRCFRDAGYHETTVDSICEGAGISKGSFYWHYGSKQEVFVDILDSWTREVMDELYEQFEGAVRVRDYMPAVTAAFEREIRRGRVIVPVWFEFTVRARQEPEIREALSRFHRRARIAVGELFRPLTVGLVTEEELGSLAAVVFGAYVGLIMQDRAEPDEAGAEAAVRLFLDVVWRWIRWFVPPGPAIVPVPAVALKAQIETHSTVAPRPSGPEPSNDEAPLLVLAPQLPRAGLRVGPDDLSLFLAVHSLEIQVRLHEVRDLLLATVPGADERIITGWKCLAYANNGLFAYIKPARRAVTLGFHRGIDLDVPNQLLEGRGRRERYVTLPLQGPLPVARLEDMIRASYAAG
jgi:AcrR family transcriptional regulator